MGWSFVKRRMAAELGPDWQSRFASFEHHASASASLGQVHKATHHDGDPLAWALERIRTRLPQMLERAGADDAARQVDPAALEAVLPRVSEAAYRARYSHDTEATLRAALA